jgi:hypothetical protein
MSTTEKAGGYSIRENGPRFERPRLGLVFLANEEGAIDRSEGYRRC